MIKPIQSVIQHPSERALAYAAEAKRTRMYITYATEHTVGFRGPFETLSEAQEFTDTLPETASVHYYFG